MDRTATKSIVLTLCPAALLIASLSPSSAWAIAGGCIDDPASPRALIAMNGTAADLDLHLTGIVDRVEKRQSLRRKALFRRNESERRAWRRAEARRWMDGVNVCTGGPGIPLLRFAVAAGNLDTTRYLLDHGVDPNAVMRLPDGRIADTLFMRCEDPTYGRIKENPVQLENRIRALRMVLQRGGDLELGTEGGSRPLHTCVHPELTRFYLEYGANPYTMSWDGSYGPHTPLRRAIADLLMHGPERHRIRRYNALERIAILVSTGNDISDHPIEKLVRERCQIPEFGDVCRELRLLVKASPRVFEPTPQPQQPGMRGERAYDP